HKDTKKGREKRFFDAAFLCVFVSWCLWGSASNLHSSGTDPKLVQLAIELVGERYHQVCDRRLLRSLNMAITLHPACASADEERRQIQTRMGIAFAHPAAIKNDCMIQQGSITVRRGLQPVEKFREQRHVIRIY